MGVHQKATLVCMFGLVPGILGATLAGVEVDIGVVLLALGALLAFVVSGIVTYLGVLQKLDAVNLLGREAMAIGTHWRRRRCRWPCRWPRRGQCPAGRSITTLGVSATTVDASPFSITGATLVASAHEEWQRRSRPPRIRALSPRANCWR